jgi:hypothetical protein
MTLTVEGYKFNFTDAINAFKFDETDPSVQTFHGVPMKAVDLIAEFADAYLFVEVKDYPGSYDPQEIRGDKECDEIDCPKRKKHYEWLKNNLKYKFRDSYLYRYAEGKADKPIHYICLLNLENAQKIKMQSDLRRELPVGKASKRWVKEFAHHCEVVDIDAWNRNFPKWPAKKVAAL